MAQNVVARAQEYLQRIDDAVANVKQRNDRRLEYDHYVSKVKKLREQNQQRVEANLAQKLARNEMKLQEHERHYLKATAASLKELESIWEHRTELDEVFRAMLRARIERQATQYDVFINMDTRFRDVFSRVESYSATGAGGGSARPYVPSTRRRTSSALSPEAGARPSPSPPPRLQKPSRPTPPVKPSLKPDTGAVPRAQAEKELDALVQQAATSNHAVAKLLFTPEEFVNYRAVFEYLDPSKSGGVSGQDAFPVFMSSKLPKSTLSKVWALSNRQKTERVSMLDFFVALRFLAVCQNGHEPSVANLRDHRDVPLPKLQMPSDFSPAYPIRLFDAPAPRAMRAPSVSWSSDDEEFLASRAKSTATPGEEDDVEGEYAGSTKQPNASVKPWKAVKYGYVAPQYEELEKECLVAFNQARRDPQSLVPLIQRQLEHLKGNMLCLPGQPHMPIHEGRPVFEEAITFLKKQKSLPECDFSTALTCSARDHTKDQKGGRIGHDGSDGSAPHDRITRHCTEASMTGENIAYGMATGMKIILGLIVDDNVPDRGHRTNIFHPSFQAVGFGCGPHAKYVVQATQNLAAMLREKDGTTSGREADIRDQDPRLLGDLARFAL